VVKTIFQKVVFKNTSVKTLYNIYMDGRMHSEAIGAPVKISNKIGDTFFSHGKYITGKNLQLIKDKLIVQSWRGADWAKDEIDSTFTLQFYQKGKDALLVMTHANVPDKHYSGIKSGWNDYYWKPWKTFLEGKKVVKKNTKM
jgi:activator of HSP90 ATPase